MSEPEQQVDGDQAAEQGEATAKQTRGRFKPGTSGNPSGRRRGAASRQTIAALVKQYGSPLEFLLRLMGDEKAKMADRLDAAKAALGFVHRRLPEYDRLNVPPLEEPPPLSPEDLAELKRNGGWPELLLPGR